MSGENKSLHVICSAFEAMKNPLQPLHLLFSSGNATLFSSFDRFPCSPPVHNTAAASAWHKAMTADGRIYYQNPVTRETRWKKPPGWVEPEEGYGSTVSEARRFFDSKGNGREVGKMTCELFSAIAKDAVVWWLLPGKGDISNSTKIGWWVTKCVIKWTEKRRLLYEENKESRAFWFRC